MSNYHNVAIAVRNREVWNKVCKAVVEAGDRLAIELFGEADLTDVHDFFGHEFLRVDWEDYNHWRDNGGKVILQALADVAADDGYAWFDMDEYGEESDSVGDEFAGLFYVQRSIGTTFVGG